MLALTLSQQTWAHRIAVGPKLLCLCIVMVVVMQLDESTQMLWVLGVITLLYATLGPSALRPALIGLRPLVLVAVAILGFHAVMGKFEIGIMLSLRIVSLVGLANFVTMTTRMSDLISLVEWMVNPLSRLGVNPRFLGLAMALFLRYLPVLRARSDALALSWHARSRRRVGVRIIVPLVLAALDDAEHLSDALRARGAITPATDNRGKT